MHIHAHEHTHSKAHTFEKINNIWKNIKFINDQQNAKKIEIKYHFTLIGLRKM